MQLNIFSSLFFLKLQAKSSKLKITQFFYAGNGYTDLSAVLEQSQSWFSLFGDSSRRSILYNPKVIVGKIGTATATSEKQILPPPWLSLLSFCKNPVYQGTL